MRDFVDRRRAIFKSTLINYIERKRERERETGKHLTLKIIISFVIRRLKMSFPYRRC